MSGPAMPNIPNPLAGSAANLAEKAAGSLPDPVEQARRERIKSQLNEEIRLRSKAPGKAQTLLTSNLVPNEMNTKTLLTSAGGK